jgi:hypothetical protein
MKETLPTMDMNSSSGARPDSPEPAKTVMAGATGQRDTPRPLPSQGNPPAWSPPPVPPPPPLPSSFQPTPGPAAGGQTVLMSTPAPQIPLAWLGVVSGPGAERGHTFVLRAETVVGRAAGDLVLSGDKTISGQHIKIRLEPKEGGAEGDQVFMLYDLASANGTYAGTRQNYSEDSSRVYRCELHDRDYILLGETTLVFLEA